MTQTLTIPNPPASEADERTLLIAGAQDCLRPAFESAEARWGPGGSDPDPAKYAMVTTLHKMLNVVGYSAEELWDLPEHSLAGGSGKGGGGGSGGGGGGGG